MDEPTKYNDSHLLKKKKTSQFKKETYLVSEQRGRTDALWQQDLEMTSVILGQKVSSNPCALFHREKKISQITWEIHQPMYADVGYMQGLR
jgi:hypothetical protein